MNFVLDRLETWQGRLVSGLAMLAALLAFLLPHPEWKADAGKAITLLIAVSTWLVATLRGANAPQPHDVRLFNKIMDLIPPAERAFLRTHEFLEGFALNEISGVREIGATWDGASYDFLDSRLHREWSATKGKIVVLRDLLARTTAPTRGGFQSVRLGRDIERDEVSERTRQEAEALNTAATQVIESLDRFEPLARRALRT